MANPTDLSEFSDHVVVCGLGHVGSRILVLLARLGERCVVITRETTEEWRAAAEVHFPVLQGDARDDALFRRVGVERARAILAVTDDDLTNVSIALDARRLNPRIVTVVRLFDQELAGHLEQSAQISRVLSTSALAAPAFAAAAWGATVRGAFEIGHEVGVIEERSVDAISARGKTVGTYATETGAAVIALEREDHPTLWPDASFSLRPGDRLTVLDFSGHALGTSIAGNKAAGGWWPAFRASLAAAREYWRGVPAALRFVLSSLLAVVAVTVAVFHFQLRLPWVDSLYFVVATVATVGYGDYNLLNAPPWLKLYGAFVMVCGAAIIAVLFSVVTDLILGTRFRGMFAPSCARHKGHIIVAGLGNIGFRLLRELTRRGETVIAIEQRDTAGLLSAARELGTVIVGNARAEETLRKAGIAGAKALIAATSDDLANLSVSFAAKRANPACRVVLRIFDAGLASKLQRNLGVEAVLSVSAAAAPSFVGAALCPEVLQGIQLPDGLVLIFARSIGHGHVHIGRKASQLGVNECGLFVKRAGSPRRDVIGPDYVVQEGDEIIGARWCGFRSQAGPP